MSLSVSLFLCLSARLSLSLIRCLAGVRVPDQGWGGSGGGGLEVGHPWTLALVLITADFLRGQDWMMVSLLPSQSDVSLPGPTSEPQGDLMQTPGLPGSPAPQSVSTQHLDLD